MTPLTDLYAQFRTLVPGKPTQTEVSNRTISVHLTNAVAWVADTLDYQRRTDDNSLALEAGVFEYPVPSDVNELIFAQWNNIELQKSSTEEWVRHSINWRGAPQGTPQEFAVDGRTFLVYPPPSSDAITTDPAIHYRYVAAGFPITAAGIVGIADTDVPLVVYVAVEEFMAFNNTQGQYDKGLESVGSFISRRLDHAMKRSQSPIRDHYPTIEPTVTRSGGGR